MRMFLPLMAAVLACTPKDAPVEAAPAAAPEVAGPEIPGDAASRKFAERLMGVRIVDWQPTGTGDVDFNYRLLTFKPDNTWGADAVIEVMDEEMGCRESGRWQMDPAEDESTAMLTWMIDATDCAGREQGGQVRVKMIIQRDGTYEIKIH